MNKSAMNYKVPGDSLIQCPSYFKNTPLSKWNVNDYAQYARVETSGTIKFGKASEQFYNAIENIRNSEESPSDVKRLLNTTLPRMRAPKPKEDAPANITNYVQCAVSSSGNASFVLNNPPASNEVPESSSSNTSALNKGKRKATEIEDSSSELQIQPEDPDAMDNLFKQPVSTPLPSISPSEFRRSVYVYGSKALSKTLYMADVFALTNLINAFNPVTLGEQLDVMSAKLAMAIDLNNIMEVNALKSSLSRIIDTVNQGVTSVFRQYMNSQLWERLEDVDMDMNDGISATAQQLYHEILAKGTINKKLDKKEIRIAIAERKLAMLKSDKMECIEILDILDIVTKNCLSDRSMYSDDDASELTCYRKFTKILDEILDNTMLDIVEGEKVSNASKTAAKYLKEMHNEDIPLNNGFGRRIDLILATKGTELSTSEWKKKKCSPAKCLQQQAKNIRINKAIMKYFLDLPLTDADKNKIMTVGMDWTGGLGYMFAVKPLDDVFVARTLYTLAMPTYVDDLPSFIDTLDHLYSWRNYHLDIKDIVLKAADKRDEKKFFSSVLGPSTTATNDTSPNIYLTPTRSRQKRPKSVIQNEAQEDCQENYQDEFSEEYEDEDE